MRRPVLLPLPEPAVTASRADDRAWALGMVRMHACSLARGFERRVEVNPLHRRGGRRWGGSGDVDVDVASLSSGWHMHLRSSHRSPTLCSLASTSKPSKRTNVPSTQTHFFRCCWLPLPLLLFAWDRLFLPVIVFTRGPDGLELVCSGGGGDGGFGWVAGLVSIVPGSVFGANPVGVGVGVGSRKSESSGSVHGSKLDQPLVDEYDGPSCKTKDRIEHPLKRTSSRIPRIPCARHSRGHSRRSYPSPPTGLVGGGIRSVSNSGSMWNLHVGQVVGS